MPLSDDVGFTCSGFEEKRVWLALSQFGEELNLNGILVEFWPMSVCSQEAALPLWRAEQEMVRAALVACVLGASGCCSALGESRAVVAWCVPCFPGPCQSDARKLPCV